MNLDPLPSDEFIFIDPNYLDCVLGASGSDDLDGLRAWCAALPENSYGHVFIEADPSELAEPLTAPPGVGITRISPAVSARGTALTGAVDAWLDEWLRGDPMSGRHFLMWTGGRDLPIVRKFWTRIEAELAEIWSSAAERRPTL
ncbi:hypothetical protein [Leucobacter iarius]|uniref:Siderophore-interacting protein C-terminal domain-containing protein n=1 Tax=Leucobacter iarius TaxID=333963 RepID=A0ABN2LFC8_9MICO